MRRSDSKRCPIAALREAVDSGHRHARLRGGPVNGDARATAGPMSTDRYLAQMAVLTAGRNNAWKVISKVGSTDRKAENACAFAYRRPRDMFIKIRQAMLFVSAVAKNASKQLMFTLMSVWWKCDFSTVRPLSNKEVDSLTA